MRSKQAHTSSPTAQHSWVNWEKNRQKLDFLKIREIWQILNLKHTHWPEKKANVKLQVLIAIMKGIFGPYVLWPFNKTAKDFWF